ncbi:hypothetical protein EVAR_8429_1 [Eumeta japonica]|uniref:Uncharacterized protein n=1 Tax=Eumeta variegata TaxID=151549 RepID=A0A4C1WCL8_EUMVA|nr:hypothetical protein EVAR_8429_1 [Eumeta japonica]
MWSTNAQRVHAKSGARFGRGRRRSAALGPARRRYRFKVERTPSLRPPRPRRRPPRRLHSRCRQALTQSLNGRARLPRERLVFYHMPLVAPASLTESISESTFRFYAIADKEPNVDVCAVRLHVRGMHCVDDAFVPSIACLNFCDNYDLPTPPLLNRNAFTYLSELNNTIGFTTGTEKNKQH